MANFLKSTLIVATITATSFTGLNAAETKDGWDGDVEVNALFTSGNTKQTSFGLGGKARYNDGVMHHNVSAFFDFNKSNGLKDRERFGGAYKFEYDINDRIFASAGVAYESNKFGAFRERIIANAAYGYKVIVEDDMNWALEAGPSILWTKPTVGADFDSEFAGYIGSKFDAKITDTTNFSNITSLFIGSSFRLENKAAITFKISDALRSKLSFDIMYDDAAAIGRKKTDTILRVGLAYDF